MRRGPIIAGSILLILGLASAIGGTVMKDTGDLCREIRCDDGDLIMLGVVGNAIFVGGALLGLTGIALLVAGIVTDAPTARNVPVVAATRALDVPAGTPAPRYAAACPSCGVDGPRDARYCASCGAAIAPTLRA